MNEVSNCPNCNSLFMKTSFRDVCEKCHEEEEKYYDKVYRYIRKKENRTATLHQVMDDTGVSEILLMKFIKSKRLNVKCYPNLGFHCEKCGSIIQEGILCASCMSEFSRELELYSRGQQCETKEVEKGTYYSKK